ncbi:hypothetical protein KKB3_01056 [Dehalococcoides mccartyi]|nr:hypothetical protein KKB3_01056 [Dehalococcoides mccartyi]
MRHLKIEGLRPKNRLHESPGTHHLLMHRFPMAGADDTSKKRTGVPDWRAEAELALYKDYHGQIYQPASHIEASLKEASKTLKIPGKRGATYSKLIGSAVSVSPDAITHLVQDYEIDSRPVVVQKARIVRYRPVFKDWELEFDINIGDDQIPIEVIKQALDHAGLYVGIGDFRPGRGGKFGKFMVVRFEEK